MTSKRRSLGGRGTRNRVGVWKVVALVTLPRRGVGAVPKDSAGMPAGPAQEAKLPRRPAALLQPPLRRCLESTCRTTTLLGLPLALGGHRLGGVVGVGCYHVLDPGLTSCSLVWLRMVTINHLLCTAAGTMEARQQCLMPLSWQRQHPRVAARQCRGLCFRQCRRHTRSAEGSFSLKS